MANHVFNTRWTPPRKAAVVLAIQNGTVTVEEVCKTCALSAEELAAWRRDYEAHGLPGLRSTRLQIYRNTQAFGPIFALTPPVEASSVVGSAGASHMRAPAPSNSTRCTN
jgi:transposase-like protein